MKVERNHSFHPNASEQWQMGLFLSVLFILDFENLMSESLSGSSCCAVLPQSCCVVNHCSKAGALSLWRPWCCEPTRLWWSLSQQFLLCCTIYLGYWEGSLCDSWLAPDLRAPNLNPSPLPSGFLSVPWHVKNKGFTMASCCICFNTRRCFLLTWTLVSHRDKQMAFR